MPHAFPRSQAFVHDPLIAWRFAGAAVATNGIADSGAATAAAAAAGAGAGEAAPTSRPALSEAEALAGAFRAALPRLTTLHPCMQKWGEKETRALESGEMLE